MMMIFLMILNILIKKCEILDSMAQKEKELKVIQKYRIILLESVKVSQVLLLLSIKILYNTEKVIVLFRNGKKSTITQVKINNPDGTSYTEVHEKVEDINQRKKPINYQEKYKNNK